MWRNATRRRQPQPARRGWRDSARRRGVLVVPRQGRRERSYLEGSGATEDAASGRPARSGDTAVFRRALPSAAVLRVRAGADLVLLEKAVVEEQLVVRLRDP